MRRFILFVSSTLFLTGVSGSLLAQRGSGGHSSGNSSHPFGSSGHASAGLSISGSHTSFASGSYSGSSARVSGRSNYPVTSVPIGASGINPGALPTGPYRGGRGYVHGYNNRFGSVGYYPYFPLFDEYNNSSYYNDDLHNAPAPDPSAAILGEQVDRLSAEVEALREQNDQQSVRRLPPSRYNAPPWMPDDEAPTSAPVTLILRDGKRIELKSYAVMGSEIWDFSSQPAKKIALARVNIEASEKATEAAGAEFPNLH